MPRKDFTFRYGGVEKLNLDPAEFKGSTVEAAERQIRRELGYRAPGEEFDAVDITTAAMELVGG